MSKIKQADPIMAFRRALEALDEVASNHPPGDFGGYEDPAILERLADYLLKVVEASKEDDEFESSGATAATADLLERVRRMP